MQRWLSDGEGDEGEGPLGEPGPSLPGSAGLTATTVLLSSPVACWATALHSTFPSVRMLVSLLHR